MSAKKGNKNALGNNGGRPTKQTLDIVQSARSYLAECNDQYQTILKGLSDGKKVEEFQYQVSLPSIAGLARWFNVSRECIYEWQKSNIEFSDICSEILAEQEKRLINGGLAGIYNSNITKLLLTKHGYTDKADITSDGESFVPVLVKFIGENGENN